MIKALLICLSIMIIGPVIYIIVSFIRDRIKQNKEINKSNDLLKKINTQIDESNKIDRSKYIPLDEVKKEFLKPPPKILDMKKLLKFGRLVKKFNAIEREYETCNTYLS